MTGALFFSLGTVGLSTRGGRKPSTLLQAARHNQRHLQREQGARSHIDPARSHLNERLTGPDTPDGVTGLARALMTGAGVDIDKLRKDYVQAVELLFSLPVNTAIDAGAYFRQCLAWAMERFGAENILGADIHRDESAPHCHILVLPLIDGRMCAGALKTRAALTSLRLSFFAEVAARFGLKASPDKMTGVTRSATVRAVLAHMGAIKDPALQSPVWPAIRQAIEHDPLPYADALGLEVAKPERKTRSFTAIMTSRGRATSEDRRGCDASGQTANTIAFEPENDRKLSCVAFGQNQASEAPHTALPIDAPSVAQRSSVPALANGNSRTGGATDWHEHVATWADALSTDVTRKRDSDYEPGQWCDVLGEFISPPTSTSRLGRTKADAWVAAALLRSAVNSTC